MVNIILIGGGNGIYFLGRQFVSNGYRVTIINRDLTETKKLSERVQALVLFGDGSDPVMLEEAGARRANLLVAMTPYDQDNLVACQLAQQMYGVPYTVAVVNDPENEAVFRQLGVCVTFAPIQLLSNTIAQKFGY